MVLAQIADQPVTETTQHPNQSSHTAFSKILEEMIRNLRDDKNKTARQCHQKTLQKTCIEMERYSNLCENIHGFGRENISPWFYSHCLRDQNAIKP